ncbi:family 20 glycosylhydrolase [Actinomycetaceae bacterium TAE3-ERU4]|nr:family 20 glycosylhydrolase [Actinomycetaceae bacterium TAE3-ERU4]
MKKLLSLLVTLMLIVGSNTSAIGTAAASTKHTPAVRTAQAVDFSNSLLPLPSKIEKRSGQPPFVLSNQSQIQASGESRLAANLLASQLRKSTGFKLPIVDNAGKKKIVYTLVSNFPDYKKISAERRSEAYSLEVNENEIKISALTPQGQIWATQTLIQLFGPWALSENQVKQEWKVVALRIDDIPRFSWRGVMLDVARSFIPLNEVKKLVDRFSYYKINRLHLHLSDDQGWRIEIPQNPADKDGIDYSQLVKKSGKTAYPKTKQTNLVGRKGYYSLAEYRELVTYAGQRGIIVVPEIDTPGHVGAILHAIPQMNGLKSFPRPAKGEKTTPFFSPFLPNASSLDIGNPVNKRFLNYIFSQVAKESRLPFTINATLQKESFFHLGGDEAYKTAHFDYINYLEENTVSAAKRGQRPIIWNDSFKRGDPKVSSKTIMQFWDSAPWLENNQAQIKKFLSRGAKIIASPATSTYFTQRENTELAGPWWACRYAQEKSCGINLFYNWDPVKDFSVPEDKILGIEGVSWSENVRTDHDLEFLLFPRILATAEVSWTDSKKKNYIDFISRLTNHTTGLNITGTTFNAHSKPEWKTVFSPAKIIAKSNRSNSSAYLLGWLSIPGKNAGELSISLSKGNSKTSLPVGLTQEKSFHYTDRGKQTGRQMGSLIGIWTNAKLPTGAQEVSLSINDGAHVLHLKTTLEVKDEQLVSILPPQHFSTNFDSSLIHSQDIFTDVKDGEGFYREIRWLRDSGVTTGWPDGTFRPSSPINRDAMAAFLYRLSGKPRVDLPQVSPFRDVKVSDPFYREIRWLRDSGVTTGWPDGTFRPSSPINRDAMAAFLYRLSR